MLCPCLLNTGVSLCLFGECIYDVFVRFFFGVFLQLFLCTISVLLILYTAVSSFIVVYVRVISITYVPLQYM